MHSGTTYHELLDAVGRLTPDEQADLAAVILKRLADQGRQRVVDDVREARKEFELGSTKPMSASDLIREIKS